VKKTLALPCFSSVFHFPISHHFPLLFGAQKPVRDLKKAPFFMSFSSCVLSRVLCESSFGPHQTLDGEGPGFVAKTCFSLVSLHRFFRLLWVAFGRFRPDREAPKSDLNSRYPPNGSIVSGSREKPCFFMKNPTPE
jgi:hypothetical protein